MPHFLKVKRVQKCVETLDVLKIKNSSQSGNDGTNISDAIQQQQNKPESPVEKHEQRYPNGHIPFRPQPQSRRTTGHSQSQMQQEAARHSPSASVVITTQWETFDPVPAMSPPVQPKPQAPSSGNNTIDPKFTWDLL